MIEVERLEKRFGAVQAVAGVSFRAENGQVTGLLGPNGAGKTTALRMIYGLVTPAAGRALVDGHDVATERMAAQASLGVLPDAKGLYPRLTARENIRYFGRLHGMRPPALEASIERLSDILDMGAVLDRRVEGFSQGERMKVAIARALVHGPRNVALDEPTNGLDVMSTRAMRSLIRRLRDDGICVLFSTHVMQEVSALCDHIHVIAHGRVVASGSPDEIRARTGKEHLEDAFVDLIGSEEGLEA